MARYIDADKVMEEINRIGGHNLCEWETIGVKALIDRQPTADVVEVKHGYWKEPMGELKIFKCRYLICSQCNVMLPIITELAAYYYCPNCGAKMDEKALKGGEKE